MRLGEPVVIQFDYDGDIHRLTSSTSNFIIQRCGIDFVCDAVYQTGAEEFVLLIDRIRIPINLSCYRQYNGVGTVKMRLEVRLQ